MICHPVNTGDPLRLRAGDLTEVTTSWLQRLQLQIYYAACRTKTHPVTARHHMLSLFESEQTVGGIGRPRLITNRGQEVLFTAIPLETHTAASQSDDVDAALRL